MFFQQGIVFKKNLVLAPKTYYAKTSDGTDFCHNGKEALDALMPAVWNDTNVLFPCREYFCNPSSKSLMPKNETPELIASILNLYNDSHVLHAMAHNWCTRCEASYTERFDLYVQNNNCPWFDQKLCDNSTCPSDHKCVYFHKRGSLCYTPDDHFMSGAGFFEYFYLRLRSWGFPYVYFIVNAVVLCINIFVTVLPELGHLRRYFAIPGVTGLEKFQAIFGLRNQSMMIEVLINILYIIGAFLDIINFLPFMITSICLYIHFIGVLYGWTLLIILWIHIYNQSEAQEHDKLSTKLKIAWGVVTLGVGVLIIVAIVLLLLQQILKTPSQVYIINLCLMSLIFVFVILIFCVAIGLMTMSTIILIRMERPEGGKQFTFYLFKRKLGRSIIMFIFLLLPTLFFAITSAITLVWIDFWSMETYMILQSPMNVSLACGFTILTCYTLVHDENLKLFFKYKIIN